MNSDSLATTVLPDLDGVEQAVLSLIGFKGPDSVAQTLSGLGDQLIDHYINKAKRTGASWTESEQRVRDAIEETLPPAGKKALRGHIAFRSETKEAIGQASRADPGQPRPHG
ncbi:hypothetical protein ACGFY9_28655 [Streptomyces sp. NPDC048504]|uniref:hypothetical protein n=1 Tax=Streptomyces sp. NPDC048504 TaxID=3365559 RepID=UPI003723E0CA